MIGLLARAAWFAAIYLLVLTSVAPGDLAIAAALGLSVAFALRTRGAHRRGRPPLAWLYATAGTLGTTAAEVVRGTWKTARFCLGAPARPGLVEIPRGDRSPGRIALWGVLTGEAPDEYPVDAEGDVLFVHVLDASDPDAVRARHERTDRRWQRKVVP